MEDKAKQRALEKYPLLKTEIGDLNELPRIGYLAGYHQAEKDLKLSWEDLKLLQDISHKVFADVANGSVDFYQIYPNQQSFLEEVLNRFNKQKEDGKIHD